MRGNNIQVSLVKITTKKRMEWIIKYLNPSVLICLIKEKKSQIPIIPINKSPLAGIHEILEANNGCIEKINDNMNDITLFI